MDLFEASIQKIWENLSSYISTGVDVDAVSKNIPILELAYEAEGDLCLANTADSPKPEVSPWRRCWVTRMEELIHFLKNILATSK